MTVYLGDKAVGVNTIVEKEVAKTKFGVSIDGLLGDVDADGNYIAPSERVEVNLAGVKSVPRRGLWYKFYNIGNLVINANDVVSVSYAAFTGAFAMPDRVVGNSLSVSFDNLEIIDETEAFDSACLNRHDSEANVSFKKLKKVAAHYVFRSFSSVKILSDKVFPSLEEISGNNVFYNGFLITSNSIFALSKVKKITGATSQYSSTFGNLSALNVAWNFPRATEFVRYIWNFGASAGGELHFAAANQAAIEACTGYDYKWGFAGATIYFDLMLSITVNGVVYDREHTIDGYTSWKDANGNLVYTDATAEPTVGTVVYSDVGTTQVGTVEGVA